MAEAITKDKVTKKASEPKAPEATQAKKASKATFAVFTTGGKQFRVQVGDKVKIEKLADPTIESKKPDYKEGDKLTFDQVLLTDDGASDMTLGNPFITGGEIKATLTKIARYKTVDVIKYKQKSRYFKKYGHRQPYFEIQIDSIG